MDACLIYDREGASRNRDYISYHYKVGAQMGVDFKLIYADELSNYISELMQHKDSHSTPSFAIVRTIAPDINKAIEDMGIACYNSYMVSYIANHKGRCIDYIREHTSVPVIETITVSSVDELASMNIYKEYLGYVLKLAAGHGGHQVIRIADDEQIRSTISAFLEKGDIVIQPYIEGVRRTDNGSITTVSKDVRVYVIGDEIVASVIRSAPAGEFRANYSLGGSIEGYELSGRLRDYVRQITDCLDFGMVGIDFIIDKNGEFIFNEIEDVVGARMLYKTYPQIDILRKYIEYILRM